MKKFLALALAIVMMAAIAVPAFAAPTRIDQEDDPDETKSATATVTYGVNKTYTVTVPDAVAFPTDGTNAITADVSAEDVVIPGSQKLVVSVASAAGSYTVPNSGDPGVTYDAKVEWTLVEVTKNGSNAVPYSVYVGAAGAQAKPQDADALTNALGTVLTVNSSTGAAAATGGAKLFFETVGTNQSGNYIDTLTFTVALEDVA